MAAQLTSQLLMVEPKAFGFNRETAVDNRFQKETSENLQEKALKEFWGLVERIRAEKVQVHVIPDTLEPTKPDALFPNNWISTHEDGTLVIYPMKAPNRRPERRRDIVTLLAEEYGFQIRRVVDYSFHEEKGLFLEGTGSMVFDRANEKIYANLSPRTSETLVRQFAAEIHSSPVLFEAFDRSGAPVYHTNVVMSVGEGFAVVCLEAITDTNQRRAVEASLRNDKKEIIAITREQMNQFCGNILQVQSETEHRSIIILSQQAKDAFSAQQFEQLCRQGTPVFSDLSTIETYGGGSARCMVAEIFLPLRRN